MLPQKAGFIKSCTCEHFENRTKKSPPAYHVLHSAPAGLLCDIDGIALWVTLLEDGNKPRLTFTVFVPDERKAGGKYIEVTDTVKRIDATARKVVLMSEKEAEGYRKEAESYRPHGLNKTLDFDKIVAIHGDLVNYMDNPDPA